MQSKAFVRIEWEKILLDLSNRRDTALAGSHVPGLKNDQRVHRVRVSQPGLSRCESMARNALNAISVSTALAIKQFVDPLSSCNPMEYRNSLKNRCSKDYDARHCFWRIPETGMDSPSEVLDPGI